MEVHGGSLTSRCTPARNQWKREGDTFRSRNRCLIIVSLLKAKLTLLYIASHLMSVNQSLVSLQKNQKCQIIARLEECVEKRCSDRPIYMILISEHQNPSVLLISHHEVSSGSLSMNTYAFYDTKDEQSQVFVREKI